MKWVFWLVLKLLIIFGVIAWIYFFPSEIEDNFAKGMVGFTLICLIKLWRNKMSENYTIEQNCGENRIEGGVLSVSGSVSKEKYRPFNNCDELKECYKSLYKKKTGLVPPIDVGLDVPYIWVKNKEYGTEFLITAYDNRKDLGTAVLPCVCIQEVWVDFKQLLEGYTFLDGSPVGMLEE